MNVETSRRHRINRVMNFTRHCDVELLTLDNLADVACLSRSHFLRVFNDYCSETPFEFASRIRLEQSISNLIYFPKTPITTIALDAGFASPQAFSNAFNRRFGISPRTFRKQNQWNVRGFPRQQSAPVSPTHGWQAPTSRKPCNQDVTLKTISPIRLAYLRYRGPYYHLNANFDAIQSKLYEWSKRQGLWRGELELVCVCPDNSAVTPPQFCQYDLGIAVEDGVTEDETISIQTLPEMTIAALDGDSTKDNWHWFLSEWFPQSGLRKAGHDYYEIIRLQTDNIYYPASQCTLCLPVEVDKPPSVHRTLGV